MLFLRNYNILFCRLHIHNTKESKRQKIHQKVWWRWLTLNQDVEELIKHCHSCQVNTPPKSHSQPLQLPETPQRNWEMPAVDLKGPLPWVNICYHWLQIKVPNSHILKVNNNWYNNQTNGKQVFMFQYRDTLVSDNSP